jgi:glycerol kinase
MGYLAGFRKDQSSIAEQRVINRRFLPGMDQVKKEKLYAQWKKAVRRSMHWEEE